MTTYEVHSLTGSVLVDGQGRAYGNESAGVLSRHRTREAAEKRVEQLRRTCPLGKPVEVREVVADECDILTTPDIAALCRAIDDGDEACLPILADALEEAGDPRAAGLRHVYAKSMRPLWWSGVRPKYFRHVEGANGWAYGVLPSPLYDRLEAAKEWSRSGRITSSDYLEWDVASAAYLALAEALTDE